MKPGRKPPAPAAEQGRAWTAQDVVELAVRHDLVELEVEQAGLRVRVVRKRPRRAGAPALPAETAATGALAQTAGRGEAADADVVTIEAPMVGTFYRAGSPEAAPFVAEGDLIKEGQVLCIIEAMKLMNEIEADLAGEVVRIHHENGQPVQYGEPLFAIRP